MAGYFAARTVISETSVRLLPFVWPRVEIHTRRKEVGLALGTSMVFEPGLSAVGWVIAVVSSSAFGLALVADRICTWCRYWIPRW